MLAEKEQRTSDSSLAQLLKTDQVVSRKYNDHGGGLVNPVQVLGQIPRKSECLRVSLSFIFLYIYLGVVGSSWIDRCVF